MHQQEYGVYKEVTQTKAHHQIHPLLRIHVGFDQLFQGQLKGRAVVAYTAHYIHPNGCADKGEKVFERVDVEKQYEEKKGIQQLRSGVL